MDWRSRVVCYGCLRWTRPQLHRKKDLVVNRIEKFQHEGREYEIRATARENGYAVQTFLDDVPISPTYTIDFETAVDVVNSGWGDAIDNLISVAHSDITTGRLKELADAIASK
jgi:hypothetical protein